jgi:hypothetical protein
MKSWQGLLISFAIMGIFSIAILNFVVFTQISNGVNKTILSDSIMSSFNKTIYGNLSDLNSKSKSFQNSSDSDQATEQNYQGAVSLASMFHSLSTFSGFVYAFGSSFFTLLSFIGIDTTITLTLMAILIISVGFLFWRFWKQGA